MNPIAVGILGIVILMIFMFLRMWVGATMICIGFFGCIALAGWNPATIVLGSVPYSQTANYTMACAPMFVFMGAILAVSGLGADLYSSARKWIGHIRGGLAMATIVACGFFASVCGESVPTAVTMGKISFPEMRKYNYSRSLASCCVVCGGTIGILIPPSITFIIYGMLSEQSVSELFIAGIIPGVMQVIFYMVVVGIVCRVDPGAGPAAQPATWPERFSSLKTVWPVVLIFLFIMGGLYGGMFTPTEGGAMGALAAIAVSLFLRRFTKKTFTHALKDGLQTTAMTFFVIIGAYLFMRFMTLSGLPSYLAKTIIQFRADHNISPIIIIFIIIVVYMILGCFLDMLAVVLLTVPIVTPVVAELGFSLIWWGVLMVRVSQIAMITPPFGLNLFVMSKAIDTPLTILYKGVWPFVCADVIHVAILIILPQLSLWLPATMRLM